MLTLAWYGLLAIAIMGALFLVAVTLLPAGEQIAPSVRDEAPWSLPLSHPLDASDVAAVRLPVALRGYRFAETDALLDRLGEELRARDAEIAQLRGAPVVLTFSPGGFASDSLDPSSSARPDHRPSPFAPPEPSEPVARHLQLEADDADEPVTPSPLTDDRTGEPDGA